MFDEYHTPSNCGDAHSPGELSQPGCSSKLWRRCGFIDTVLSLDDLPYHLSTHTDVYNGTVRLVGAHQSRAVVIKVWRLQSPTVLQRRRFHLVS